MRLTHHENLHQLTFSPFTIAVNCYLVEEDTGLTLIDAGLPASIASILETAEKIGKPISNISFTHPHFDHVGDIHKIKQAYPFAKIFLSRRDAPLFAGNTSLLPGEPDTPVKGTMPENFPLPPDGLLEDGDMLGSLKIIALAGHTPGSIGFLDTRSGILLTGDAMQTKGGLTIAGQRNILFPFPAMATWNFEAAVHSVENAVLKNTIHAIGPGHGTLMPVDRPRLMQVIEEAKTQIK